MTRIVIFIFILSLSACAINSKNYKDLNKTTKSPKRPEWVSKTSLGCINLKEFCASGSAPGLVSADSEARRSLAQRIETKVTSHFSTATTMEQEGNFGEQKIYAADVINEFTDVLLEGVYIKERWEGKDSYYSLAALDKQMMSKLIARRINKLEEGFNDLVNLGNRSGMRKGKVALDKIEFLNQRHLIITGRELPLKVSLKDFKAAKKKEGKLVRLTTEKGQNQLHSFFVNLLTDRYHKVLSTEDKSPYLLRVKIIEDKMYLNVKGFVKYRFKVFATLNERGKKNGSLEVENIQVGRTKSDALGKALSFLRREIENRFEELTL